MSRRLGNLHFLVDPWSLDLGDYGLKPLIGFRLKLYRVFLFQNFRILRILVVFVVILSLFYSGLTLFWWYTCWCIPLIKVYGKNVYLWSSGQVVGFTNVYFHIRRF